MCHSIHVKVKDNSNKVSPLLPRLCGPPGLSAAKPAWQLPLPSDHLSSPSKSPLRRIILYLKTKNIGLQANM